MDKATLDKYREAMDWGGKFAKKYLNTPNVRKLQIHKAVMDIRNNLHWELRDIVSTSAIKNLKTVDPKILRDCNSMFRINSEPLMYIHEIYWPQLGLYNDPKWICYDYLHELTHAYLCEKVHPLFSTSHFVPNAVDLIKELGDSFVFIFMSAQDWFVNAKLDELQPALHRKCMSNVDIEIALKEIANATHDTLNATLYGVGDVIARLYHYFNKEVIVGDDNINFIVKAYKSVNPNQPTLENLQILINKLLVVRFPNYCVEAIDHKVDDIKGHLKEVQYWSLTKSA